MSPVPPDLPDVDVEAYARAAASALGLTIDEAWWPSVARHLEVMLSRAATLESFPVELPDDAAAVFQP